MEKNTNGYLVRISMAANEVLIMKENATGDFQVHTVTAQANKVLGFDSGLNPVMMDAGSGATFYTQSNLSINGNNGDFFVVTLTGNATMSLSNIAAGKFHYVLIKNTGYNQVTVTLPTGVYRPLPILGITTSTAVLLSIMSTGTDTVIHIGEEMAV